MTVIRRTGLYLSILATAALLLVAEPAARAEAALAASAPTTSTGASSKPAASPAVVTGHFHTSAAPSVRVTNKVDDSKRTMLYGHVPTALSHATDLGRIDPKTPAEHLVMVLKSSDAQKQELRKVLDEQQDKNTENYHQWVTPEEFGNHFGVHDADIAKVSAWLKTQGFTVEDVSKSKRVLHFSGTTGQIEKAFQTEMHGYRVGTETHVSINSDITVPAALHPVIAGVTLHNFFRKGHMGPVKRLSDVKREDKLNPLYTSGTGGLTHYVGPWDFATIYNTFPLLNAGITGAGTSIAVVGRSDILLSDVQTYRSLFDLPANDPIFIHAGQDNGTQPGDDGESDLDVEISGGIAQNAQVYFVIGTPTFLVDGITNSIEYIVENNTADIVSISYGSCESIEGTGGNEFNNQAFEQGAAQGMSIFVAAGDNGPAECDNQNDTYENLGYSTGGEASTPYSVSVGGSQGYEGTTATAEAPYWSSTSQQAPYWGLSAISYIPEVPWNESKIADFSDDTSGLAGLWSGSGGISSYYLQPSWQRGSGITGTDPVATKGGDWVTAVTLTNGGGSGYTAAPTITFTGGGCVTEPAATTTISGGAVASVVFNFGTQGGTLAAGRGFGCTSAPAVAFTAAPTGGTTATATTTIGAMWNILPLVAGVPHRLTPDLVLNAASGHDATLFCSEGSCEYSISGSTVSLVDAGLVGGTSVAAPSMAGIQALINQANGGRQGMPGYIYYALSAAQTEANCNSTSGNAIGTGCAFQDITQGDNFICGASSCTTANAATNKMGWAAGTGYDLASGLGSVNAANLSSQWKNVVFNSSSTTLSLSQATGVAQGSSITLSGTVAAGSGSSVPTGDVAFILSKGDLGSTIDISGDANDGAFIGPKSFATLNNGSYSATLTNLPGGSYTITARYGGDTTFASSLSTAVPVSVAQGGAPTITITPQTLNLLTCVSTNSSAYTYGVPAYIPINVSAASGVPTGTLTITVDGNTWGTVPLDPNGNGYLIAGNFGTAANSCLYDYLFSQGPFLQGGSHSIGASYSGDSTFPAATATPVTVTVAQLSSIPTLSVGAQNITSGFTLPLVSTFAVSSLTSGSPAAATGPTGTVTYTDTTTGATLGTATVVPTAVYTVTPSSTTSYPSYTYGAVATGSTTGVTVSGANAITSSYSGDVNYAPTVSTATTVTVDATAPVATTTTITSSANPTTIGGRPTFTATIAAASGTAPTSGTVTFYDGSTLLGSGTVGTAHTTTFRPASTTAFVGGTHSITGVYGGITANGPSTSAAFTETVTKGTGTITLAVKSIGLVGQANTFTAVLTPSVTGTTSAPYPPVLSSVQFFDGTTNIGSAVASTINGAQGGYGLWTAPLTVTNLAVGSHTITASYSDTNYTLTTSAAQTVKVYGSPVGNLEEAVDGTTGSTTVATTDSIFISGWAADPTDGSPLSTVKVYIDGVSIGTPTLGISRTDVGSAYNNSAYNNSGYQMSYSAGSLSVGSHAITVVATNGGKVSKTFGPLTINVAVVYAAPVGNLEQAVDQGNGASTVPTKDLLYVSGWIADPTDGSPMSNVKVYIDGTSIGTPTLNQSRPDVANYYNNQAYANSGFYLSYAAKTLTPGSHSVTVVGINTHSVSKTLGPISITVTDVPVGAVDIAGDSSTGASSVSQSTGTLYVGGWAADYYDQGAAQQVQILVDGAAVGLATLGQSRQDVASYYNQPTWNTSGYGFVITASGLSQGSHTITAVATNKSGNTSTLGPQTVTVTP